MLTREDNEILTRVGPGTPMGELMRQYWLPVLISWELPHPDSDPLRVRLLGEDLIAFRDTNGDVGMLGARCTHRGAPLFFARNEECGLRCVYHGWKYDIHGHCVDMPNEPAESNFKDKILHKAYPCVERGGMIWTYMGPRRTPPPLPNLEWTGVPDDHRILAKRVQVANWAQALEGDIDSGHLGFTHSRVADHRPIPEDQIDALPSSARYGRRDKHPVFEVLDTEYGTLISARRDAEEDSYYYRISQFLMPFWTLVASGTERNDPTRGTRAWVPIDDESTLIFATTFHPLRPLTEQERSVLKTGGGAGYVGDDHLLPPTNEPFGRWRPRANVSNEYLHDRGLQRTTSFSGLPEFWSQDAALQEGMGVIYDRTEEHVGASDTAIVKMRARVLNAAKALRADGATPAGVDDPDSYQVRASAAVLPREVHWLEATEHLLRVNLGTNPGGTEVGIAVPGQRA